MKTLLGSLIYKLVAMAEWHKKKAAIRDGYEPYRWMRYGEYNRKIVATTKLLMKKTGDL